MGRDGWAAKLPSVGSTIVLREVEALLVSTLPHPRFSTGFWTLALLLLLQEVICDAERLPSVNAREDKFRVETEVTEPALDLLIAIVVDTRFALFAFSFDTSTFT